MLGLCVLPLHVLAVVSGISALDVNFVTLTYTLPSSSFASQAYVGSVIDIAVQTMRRKYKETLNVTNTYLMDSRYMDCATLSNNADEVVSQWYYHHKSTDGVDVLLAPACLENSTVNYLAASWDLLLISTISASHQIRQRASSPTWISTAYVSASQYAEFFNETLRQYTWTSVFMLVDEASVPMYASLAYSVRQLIDIQPRTVRLRTINSQLGVDYARELESFNNHSRVMLYFGHPQYLRQLLIRAKRMNMTDGEHVYVAVEIFRNRLFGNLSSQYPNSTEKDNNDAKDAFRSLLVFQPADSSLEGTAHATDQLPLARDLSRHFHRQSRQTYNLMYSINDQPFNSIAASYSAVAALCQILDNVVYYQLNISWKSGMSLAREFYNQTFYDETGIEFYIDDKGERRMDLALTFSSTSSDQREPFLLMSAASSNFTLLKQPTWPGFWPPPDEPICGYHHENQHDSRCQPPVDNRWIYGSVFGTIFGVLTLGWIILRRIRRIKEKEEEKKLLDPWWQINSELLRPLAQAGSGTQAQQAKTLNTKFKIPAVAVYDDRPVMLTPIAISSRYIYTSEITNHRHLLLLFKRLRKVSHTGICRFLGLTILENNFEQHITIISEYASKASLYEVFDLYGELDLGVRSSFARDFLEALEYIHDSSLMYHGRLSTFRVHVDKFFAVKIIHLAYERVQRGLDPRYFKMRKYDCDEWEPAYWAAPEFFNQHIISGRKRDIYSTGFILFEIITQERLYKRLTYMDPADLDFGEHNPLQQTMNFNLLPKPFKPMVPALQSCWSANPDQRPSIAQLKSYFTEMSSGPAGSRKVGGEQVMDKLIQRLQDYTEELHNDINQKSLQLEQQIEKYYEILAYKLPAYVVNRMRSGDGPVMGAEKLDSVSVLLIAVQDLVPFMEQHTPTDTIVTVNVIEAILEDLIGKFHVSRIANLSDCSAFVAGMSAGSTALDSARELCAFALTLQSTVREVFIDRPNTVFLKLAINTGSCTAAVMGKGMKLQYKLLGNVLRVGVVLCNHSLPDHIHIAKPTAQLIAACPEFATELRVPAFTKHADLATFWLYSTNIQILADVIETNADMPSTSTVEVHHAPADDDPPFVPHPLPPDD